MSARSLARLALAGAIIVMLGCAQGDEAAEEGGMEMAAMPDTTAAAVWAHLEEANYQGWELWPDKGELYSGGVPHGMLLTTYLNGTAHEALAGGATSMPAGAIIVKENYMPDSTLDAVTVMYKAESFNPDHNDWFWMKRGADGTVAASGRVDGCQNCHGARANNDYVLTATLGQN